jgi:hypothetical protein
MKLRLHRLWKINKKNIGLPDDPALRHSCAGRFINALTFIVIIICLGSWITAFLLLKDRLFSEALSENILTNLTCLTFFGGLAMSIFIGAWAGNTLRRIFWKRIIQRRKDDK